jgi:subtilisin family serine protease
MKTAIATSSLQQKSRLLTLSALAVATALTAMIPVRAFAEDAPQFARGRILVEPKPGLTGEEFDTILKRHGGKGRRKLGQSNMHVVELPAGASEADVVQLLRKHPELKYAELDRKVMVSATANDPYMGSEWHLSKMGATSAWDTTQGNGVVIAILDSGVDASHPDLAAQMVPGYNIYNNNTDTADVCGHGTGVAGTAAAATNNGAGVAGVAGGAKIMPVRIAFADASGACYAYLSTIASGITWAADHGAKIANISYDGLAGSSAVLSAAAYMKSKGGLVFVAAGNDGTSRTFAPTTNVIVVSATDSTDTKASWSSYGPAVSLAAPGAGIWSTAKGGTYKSWNGTSFAAPAAAGVAALVMATNPGMSNTAVESMLFATAVDLGTAGRDNLYGYGRVNASAAVAAAKAKLVAPVVDSTAPTVAIAQPLGSSTVSGSVAVNVNATDNVGVARVDLKVNGNVVASDAGAPFAFTWDSKGVANGMASLVAVAYDASGNVASSTPIAVNVSNTTTVAPVADKIAPVVNIANPVAGAVSGKVAVTINASDNSGAAGISLTLYIDGRAVATGKGSTMSYSWDTTSITRGSHAVQTIARDAAGNSSSKVVFVTR